MNRFARIKHQPPGILAFDETKRKRQKGKKINWQEDYNNEAIPKILGPR